MKYVFVTFKPSFSFSTPESWFKRTEGYAGLPECLAKNNEVINLKQIDYDGDLVHNGVHYYFFNFGEDKTNFPVKLIRFIKSLKPDVVFVQGLHNPIQLLLLGLKLDKHTKIIVQNHAEKPLAGIKKYILKLADKFVGAYLFASQAMGMEWIEKGNFSSPAKIHEVMEVSSRFYPIEKSEAWLKTGVTGDPVFLWVGRLDTNKDPLNVVKAFLQFVKTNSDARLYMIYQADELLGDIKKLLKDDSHNAITLIGQVSHDDLLYWFNSADFLISGSHYEGSGTVVCEAMSCGCVPVVTDILSFRVITDNGKCGLLYEPGNEEALLAVLLRLNDADKEGLGKRSLEYFRDNLSFEAIAGRVERIAAGL